MLALRGFLQCVLAADPSDELKLIEDSLRLSFTEKEPETARSGEAAPEP